MRIDATISRLSAELINERRENEIIEQLEVTAQGVGAIRYDKEGSSSDDSDRMEKAAIRLAETRTKIAKQRIERAAFRAEASGRFYNLLDAVPAYFLDLHYVRGLTFRQIGELTGRAPGTVCEIVKRARKEITAIYARFGEDVEI